MGNLLFRDSAYPVDPIPTGFDGVQFYIGGDTPHVWTPAEVNAQPERYRLPTFTRSNPDVSLAAGDVVAALAQLKAIGAPKHTLVCLDSETSINPNYVAEFFYGMANGSYPVIDYGSASTVFGNQIPDGYYDAAQWTGQAHIVPGSQMTQWEALNVIDESTALSTLPFWDTQVNVNPLEHTVSEDEAMELKTTKDAVDVLRFPVFPQFLFLATDFLGSSVTTTSVRVALHVGGETWDIENVTLTPSTPTATLSFPTQKYDIASFQRQDDGPVVAVSWR